MQGCFLEGKSITFAPPIPTRSREESSLLLHLPVINHTMSSILAHETYKAERHIYFVSTILKGVEARYQKIEKLTLDVLVIARKLWPYFWGHKIFMKTNHPVRQVLRKLDMAGRMVFWAVELSEYDIQCILRGSIGS